MANFLSQYSGAQVEEAVRKALGMATVAETGSYRDLSNTPIYCDTTAYWQSHSSFKGEKGDIIIYSDYKTTEDGKNIAGIKIADGLAYAIDLPFVTSILESELNAHINNSDIHVSTAEKTFWNNKVSAKIDTIDTENLILTTN